MISARKRPVPLYSMDMEALQSLSVAASGVVLNRLLKKQPLAGFSVFGSLNLYIRSVVGRFWLPGS